MLGIIKKWMPLALMWIFCIICGLAAWKIIANDLQSWKLWMAMTGVVLVLAMTVIFTVLYARKKDMQQ